MSRLLTSTIPTLEFDYINYRGEASRRRARPFGVEWTSNEYHPDEQWILQAFDLEKKAVRYFAMRDMTNIRKVEEPRP